MYSVLLTIHVLVTIFLIGIILVQRSASDGMGLSGSSSTSFLSGRAAANAVTRTTSILAALFLLTSLALGVITAHGHTAPTSIMDRLSGNGKPAAAAATGAAPATTTTAPAAPAAPATPAKPSVPRPE